MIENTSQRDALAHLLGLMSDGNDKYITGMEAAGQRQLVNSTDLPTKLNGGTDADFEALGFTFGEPHEHDAMFRPATLPNGWKREGSDHAMWSYIVDELGRRRVSIFYKAAFYDRSAFMSLNTPHGYLREVLYDGREPVLDDEWLTREVAVAELAGIVERHRADAAQADRLAQQETPNPSYWTERATERRADAAKADALRAKLAVA